MCLNAGGVNRLDAESQTLIAFTSKDYGADATRDVAPTLRAMGHAGSHANGGGQLAVCLTFDSKESVTLCNEHVSPTLTAGMKGKEGGRVAVCLSGPKVMTGPSVRRLTEMECERLQGFDDGHTAVAGLSSGARYKALGNSMVVPVIRWIGRQIEKTS